MLKRHSHGQELGELVSTAQNTYVNPGSVAQFDFHQSDKSNVSLPLLSFLPSNDLMESVRVWYHMNSVFIEHRCQLVRIISSTWKNHLGRARTRPSHCQSHNFQGSLPLDAVPSSRAPSGNLCLPLPPLSSKHLTSSKKKLDCFLKTFFFTLNPYPKTSTASVFVEIVLSSKWTGVFLKGYRQNWQETAPGEEKVNQLLNTTCNK